MTASLRRAARNASYEQLAARAPRLAFALFRPRAFIVLACRRAFERRQVAAELGALEWRPLHAPAPDSRELVAVEQPSDYAKMVLSELNLVHHIAGARETVLTGPERSSAEREAKISYLNLLVRERRVDRVRWFTELARVERLQGHALIAATYDLRVMRWLGGDVSGALPFTTATLEEHGFEEEAAAARALYGPKRDRRRLAREVLGRQRGRWRLNPAPEMACDIVDRRAPSPLVTVVVSLYATGDKLSRFLKMLSQQTMFAQGSVEVIFIDSASPHQERAIIDSDPTRLPYIYIRTLKRETIQAAWNRALRHARGTYLIFMGVDEGLRPDGLALLVDALERNPDANWAMADSLVNRVDRRGTPDQDVMLYDRRGYRRPLSTLESTYVAYVGGLYRRRLHDSFGYYDPRFRAAGDTEFKNRVLPSLTVTRVPETLGVFNDYPEDRMSAHPRAEIEDLRAWYIHREPAALSTSYSLEELRELLRCALGYRKCYTEHISLDVDVALAAAKEIARCTEEEADVLRVRQVAGLQTEVRSLELWEHGGGQDGARLASDVLRRIEKILNFVRQDIGVEPLSNIFHDNRFEQHHWSWSER